MAAPVQPRRGKAAAGRGGAAFREGTRPRGARRWRASLRRGGTRRAAAAHGAPTAAHGVPAAARRQTGGGMAGTEGEKLGELEWVARKLTAQSIWTEDGRREKLDEKAELRRRAAMAPDG